MTREKKRKKRFSEAEKKTPLFDLHPETKQGIIGILFLAFALISALAHLELGGPAGSYLVRGARYFIGVGAYLLPFLFLTLAVVFFGTWRRRIYFTTGIGSALFLAGILGIGDLSSGELHAGGRVGEIITLPLLRIFGFWGAVVILTAVSLVGILIILNTSFRSLLNIGRGGEGAQSERGYVPAAAIAKEAEPSGVRIWTDAKPERAKAFSDLWKKVMPRPKFQTSAITEKDEQRSEETQEHSVHKKEEPVRDDFIPAGAGLLPALPFERPSLDFLEEDKGVPSSGDIKANVNVIKRTLANFGIEVEMGEVSVGPSVTQYTLKPAEGVKLSRIHGLQNDLALALAAYPLRIEAPIPGRSLVGIEIPNRTTTLVRLRNLLANDTYQTSEARLLLALGRDVTGEALYGDLAKMPHLLIAGSTGSGKSVCVHSILASLLYRNTPEQLQLLLVDPKRVELSGYHGIPHLLHPVIVEGKRAILALRWTVREMERRYELLSEIHARDIASYNESASRKKNAHYLPIPYITVVVDELADLMAAHARDVETMIVRLAQMARAVGIHLIVSTQRPSIDVITGLIKANITTRIAFQMASQVDSRTVLDMAGAEKLLGNGDMLYLAGDASKPKRIQGAFVSEREVKRLAGHLRKFGASAEGAEAIDLAQSAGASLSSGDGSMGSSGDYEDDLYSDALAVVRESKKASASLLQRRLRVGYARAARLLDILEEKGMIGPGEGAKPRIVYGVDNSESALETENNSSEVA
ncbi:MAG: DNA translocase FtsK 4TM domain-containing protein [Parcubacteria group bacterium]|nr:DNA translocase FtsK 4TM domain-containing protein [Parcubacteria group bacterium]